MDNNYKNSAQNWCHMKQETHFHKRKNQFNKWPPQKPPVKVPNDTGRVETCADEDAERLADAKARDSPSVAKQLDVVVKDLEM